MATNENGELGNPSVLHSPTEKVPKDENLNGSSTKLANPSKSDANAAELSEEVNEPERKFGWCSFTPDWLQGFCNVKWALFWLCWGGALQGLIVNGLMSVSITTLEKRFGLKSSQTGIIVSGYDISSFIFLAPVSYMGGQVGASKPLYMGWGTFIMGIGSLIITLPHFLVGQYAASQTEATICNAQQNATAASMFFFNDNITDEVNDFSWTVWIFFFGQILIGIGATPLYTLGVAYIDENVSKKMSSVYLGINYMMAIVGPALGYVIGGAVLNFYVDFMVVNPSDIGVTTDSSAWVGAWWLGFLLAGIVCIILAVPMMAYPIALPGSEKLKLERVSEAYNADKDTTPTFVRLHELPKAFAVLMKNPTFVCVSLAGSFEALLITGFAAFLPKQIENIFNTSPMTAAFMVGLITVPAGGGGVFIGGYIVKRFKLTCAAIIKLCVILTIIAVAFSQGLLLRCPNMDFAGVTVDYHIPSMQEQNFRSPITLARNPFMPIASDHSVLEAACNKNCTCSRADYDPICGFDNIMYYNPCYAGCKEEYNMGHKKFYTNCSCIEDDQLTRLDYSSMRSNATNIVCETDCNLLPYFVVTAFILFSLTFLAIMPALSATIRSVHDDQRSFALGIQWMMMRLFGTIPAPLFFGAIIDTTCILWHDVSDDRSGNCLLYDNDEISKYLWMIALIGKVCSFSLFTLAWKLYKAPKALLISKTEQMDDKSIDEQSNKIDQMEGEKTHHER